MNNNISIHSPKCSSIFFVLLDYLSYSMVQALYSILILTSLLTKVSSQVFGKHDQNVNKNETSSWSPRPMVKRHNSGFLNIGGARTSVEDHHVENYNYNNSSDNRFNSDKQRNDYFGGRARIDNWRDWLLIINSILHAFWILLFLLRSRLSKFYDLVLDCCCSTSSVDRLHKIKQSKRSNPPGPNLTSNIILADVERDAAAAPSIQTPKRQPTGQALNFNDSYFTDY